MTIYRRRTWVDAPLAEVWAFHSRIAGLEALTPDWMGLRVEAVHGPEGESDPDVLKEGTRIHLSVRPFGVGPRQRWTSEIRRRECDEGEAVFVDEMVDGPFSTWVHTHQFAARGEGTVVTDAVEYDLPGGRPARALAPLARIGFEPMFAYRHCRTRRLLE